MLLIFSTFYPSRCHTVDSIISLLQLYISFLHQNPSYFTVYTWYFSFPLLSFSFCIHSHLSLSYTLAFSSLHSPFSCPPPPLLTCFLSQPSPKPRTHSFSFSWAGCLICGQHRASSPMKCESLGCGSGGWRRWRLCSLTFRRGASSTMEMHTSCSATAERMEVTCTCGWVCSVGLHLIKLVVDRSQLNDKFL